MTDLSGKIALVTGGARGVGRAIVAELTGRGAHVLINYFHSHDAAKAARAEFEAGGARVDLIRASVARQDQVERMFADIERSVRRPGHPGQQRRQRGVGAGRRGHRGGTSTGPSTPTTRAACGVRGGRAADGRREAAARSSLVSALGSTQFVMANYLACAPAKAAAVDGGALSRRGVRAAEHPGEHGLRVHARQRGGGQVSAARRTCSR